MRAPSYNDIAHHSCAPIWQAPAACSCFPSTSAPPGCSCLPAAQACFLRATNELPDVSLLEYVFASSLPTTSSVHDRQTSWNPQLCEDEWRVFASYDGVWCNTRSTSMVFRFNTFDLKCEFTASSGLTEEAALCRFSRHVSSSGTRTQRLDFASFQLMAYQRLSSDAWLLHPCVSNSTYRAPSGYTKWSTATELAFEVIPSKRQSSGGRAEPTARVHLGGRSGPPEIRPLKILPNLLLDSDAAAF